jgi:hypothetical protein
MTLVEQDKEMFRDMSKAGVVELDGYTKKELARYVEFLKGQLDSSNRKQSSLIKQLDSARQAGIGNVNY